MDDVNKQAVFENPMYYSCIVSWQKKIKKIKLAVDERRYMCNDT